MENFSLYRKYRPHNFENLVGQNHIKTTLINAFKSGQVSHTYIFSGPRGTGKTTTARLIAKALNCSNPKDGFEPCMECEFCKDIAEGRLIDLIEIDAASNRGIDEIRELKDKINFAPTRSKYKVYIIDEVHMLTTFAFNALLKTLEEPPAHAYFILATTELHKIPETIISRCQNFEFKRIKEKELADRLAYIAEKEGIDTEPAALQMISKYVNGGLRDAIGLLEQMAVNAKIDVASVSELLGISSLDILNEFYLAIKSKNTKLALDIVQKIYSSGIDIRQFLHDFINLLREKINLCLEQGENRGVLAYMKIIEIFQDAQKISNQNIPQLPLEIAVIKTTIDPGQAKSQATPPQIVTQSVVQSVAPKVLQPQPREEPKMENLIAEKREHKAVKVDLAGDASIEDFKKNWVSVLDQIGKPTIQRSLKNGHPVKLEGQKLFLKFFSSFHNDVVMKTESRVAVEKTIFDVFGLNVILDSIVEERPQEIENYTPTVVIPAQKPEAQKPAPKDKVTNEALDIFGGNVIS